MVTSKICNNDNNMKRFKVQIEENLVKAYNMIKTKTFAALRG